MNDEIENWEREEGVDLIRKIGIEEGDAVLDFGAGYGHYSLPAAEVVGKKGIVFSVDKRKKALKAIAQKASERGLTNNIKIIKNSGDVTIKFKHDIIDQVLLFDIIHIFEKKERKILFKEVNDVLKPGKTLSIYLRHGLSEEHRKDYSSDAFTEEYKEELVKELKEADLIFDEEICKTLVHDVEFVEGCVLNFRKI
ncbi:MAG: class I SAM-dependent methyltransferase [Thermoplasmata archaeon]